MKRAWQSAVDAGDLERVRALVEEGADVDALDRYGQTGLMRAAVRGRLEVVQYLIERGANLDVAAKYGLTALMLAIVNLHEDVAAALIEAGAALEPRGSGAPGFSGLTALDLARARNLEATVALLERAGAPGGGAAR